MPEKESFYGEAWIDAIKNIHTDELKNQECKHMDESNVSFVHYPDCQQLIVWLPEYYNNYSTISIVDSDSEENIFQNNINDIISGGTEIIIDSLFIRPGNFVVSIQANCGLTHEIYFNKLKEGEKVSPTPVDKPVEDEDVVKEPIVYRDGAGNIIKNEDLDWRDVYY